MGTWVYKTWSEKIGNFSPESGIDPIPFYRLYSQQEYYVPSWRRNPVTGVWEQDPNDERILGKTN